MQPNFVRCTLCGFGEFGEFSFGIRLTPWLAKFRGNRIKEAHHSQLPFRPHPAPSFVDTRSSCYDNINTIF
jgi:hypothetical protein